jgi:hypothetical protein
VEELVVGVFLSGVVFRVALVGILAEEVADTSVSVTFFHVVSENAFFVSDDIALSISGGIYFIIILFLMLELGVFNQFLLASSQKCSMMDG